MKDRWIESTLGEAYDVRDGTHDSPKYQEEGYALITSKNLKNSSITYDRIKFISEYDYININKRSEVNVGDILFAMIGTIGNPVVVKNKPDFAIKNVALFKVPNEQDSDFLKYYLESSYVKEKMQREAKGTTQKFVGLGYLRTFPISLPPLSEQKRIVAILDEAFAGIDTAIANTEKNLANARELFESYLNLVFSQSGQDWFETTLGKEINLLTGFAFKSKEYTNSTDGISLLRGDNIIQGEFRWQNVKKWPKKDMHIYNKYLLEIGDIVLAMDRTWVKAGLKYAQISEEDVPCLLVQRVARLRAGKNLDSHYLKYLLGSIGFTRYVLSIQTGLGVPHISGKQICDFEFSCPPIEEQKKLANKFDEIEINTKRLTSIYQQKLNSLKELNQSLLQKAFSGELTAKPDKLMDENVA